jgi:2,4-dienoyl-CoA reductase (NADPH2)
VLLAAAAPGRAEFGRVVRDLLGECRAAGVEIRTGVDVDAALVEREDPDVVVLATGARPRLPAWAVPGRVVDVRDVLSGAVRPQGRVLVYDELGFHQAPAAAELLAARGRRVEIMTPALVVAQDLGTTLDAELFHRRAHAAGIALTTDRLVTGVDGERVAVLHHTTGAVEERRVDAVVSVVPPEPDDALWPLLRDGPRPVHRIGDCLAPRRVPSAVVEGDRVAVGL